MGEKVLFIVGPTATGKTELALELAREFNGDLISADSRQVYRGMDIITGKDIPENSISVTSLGNQGWKTEDGVNIWLTDVVGPKDNFSVSAWHLLAKKAIERLWSENKLPILVGGTGLYIDSLVKNMETLDVPPNQSLRASFRDKTPEELFDILARLDSLKAASLNDSDKNNPRRLIRAVEVALDKGKTKGNFVLKDFLIIGLKAKKELLSERISSRVDSRVESGIKEIENLLSSGVTWDDRAMTAIGYRELKAYFLQESTLGKAVESWKRAERVYSRKQMSWFKRRKEINWFDIEDSTMTTKVEKLVKDWYN